VSLKTYEKYCKVKWVRSNDINRVIKIKEEYPLSGPERIRKYLLKLNIKLSKNSIYRILLSLNMVDNNKNKKNQRKYVKYEREHRNSIWTGQSIIRMRN
jgi:hypothetical protein